MKNITYLIKKAFLFALIYTVSINCLSAQQIAFPGAEGYGKYAAGGRGGDVYHVINLDDDGVGSLRYGIENASGPRTIVFDLSGTIYLKDRLKVDSPNITIAGQTAPGDGITIAGNYFGVGAGHVIVRYIRVRLGDQSGGDDDAVHISAGSNIIFDHVTASWSVDETFSFQDSRIDSLTVQWCMVTESLRNSHHEKGAHGYGGIVGGLRQTLHHNLYAHHSSRSPKVSGRRHCEVDFRNNVLYNWGYNNCYDGTSSYLNWANNYYKAGPATDSNVRYRIFKLSDQDIDPSNDDWEDSQNYETSLYAEGNYLDGYPSVTADNWSGGVDFDNGATETKNRAHTAFDFPAITEQTAIDAYPLVVAGAGASLVRDIIDVRIAYEVLTGTTTYVGSVSGDPGIIDSQTDVGGWPELSSLPPPTDTDQDGMPDAWEIEVGLNPNDPEDRNDDRNLDGYTNLEEYLYSLVPVDSNPKPGLNLISPIEGAGYLPADTIFIKAASNFYGDNSFGSMDLFIDGDIISSYDSSIVDTFLIGLPTGSHTIKVKVTDLAGNYTIDSIKIYSGSALFTIKDSVLIGGIMIMDPPGGTYVESTEVSVFAIPDNTFFFGGWTGDSISIENPLLLTVSRDIELIANFVEDTNPVINVNFQPVTSDIPEGYYPDYGYKYALHENGLSYGWVGTYNFQTRERSHADLRMATLNHMQSSGDVPWEIQLDSAYYVVSIHMGDAENTDQINSLDVEGIKKIDDTPNTGNFDVFDFDGVLVADGKLTLTPIGDNAKINFISISKLVGNYLIVNSGTGSGEYEPGTVVNITADEAENSWLFDGWIGDVSYLEDSTASSTSLTIPEGIISVSATYKDYTSIMEKKVRQKSIRCYPNPASSSFSIELNGIENPHIEMYNLMGELVYNAVSNENIHRISEHSLTPGLYLIKVTDINGETYFQKLIVENK